MTSAKRCGASERTTYPSCAARAVIHPREASSFTCLIPTASLWSTASGWRNSLRWTFASTAGFRRSPNRLTFGEGRQTNASAPLAKSKPSPRPEGDPIDAKQGNSAVWRRALRGSSRAQDAHSSDRPRSYCQYRGRLSDFAALARTARTRRREADRQENRCDQQRGDGPVVC